MATKESPRPLGCRRQLCALSVNGSAIPRISQSTVSSSHYRFMRRPTKRLHQVGPFNILPLAAGGGFRKFGLTATLLHENNARTVFVKWIREQRLIHSYSSAAYT